MSGHIPYRRCIACMQSKPKLDLIKINPGARGKGQYICNDEKCVALAKKKKRISEDFNLYSGGN